MQLYEEIWSLLIPIGSRCVKSVQIRSFSGPYFPVFGLNTEIYGYEISVFSPNTGKYGPEKTPYLDTLHAVSADHNVIVSFETVIRMAFK